MKNLLVATLLLFAAIGIAYSQSPTLPPFVSRLTAVSGEQGVLLTWQDIENGSGAYHVYRHSMEIDETTFSNATLLDRVAQGNQQYLDIPESEGPHYYAVLAGGADGLLNEIFIPYRNKTTRGLRFEIVEDAEEVTIPIGGIDARVAENLVIIDYAARAGKDIVVYRSTAPMLSEDDLVGAVLVETLVSSSAPYADRPLAGVEYYYGIFYDENLRTGNARFDQGENILLLPVSIALETVKTDSVANTGRRARPLPFLMLSSTVDTGERLKAGPYETSVAASPLEDKTRSAVNRLLANGEGPIFGNREPEWLAGDGATGPFHDMLANLMRSKQWELALAQLESYMQTRRTGDEAQKAYFYKGQCFYFLAEYEQSFVHFIFAEDNYYPQVQPWLDEIIAVLASL